MSPNNQISSLPVSGHSVPPTEADPLTSMEGVFSHSVTSTEGVFCHSVLPTEADPLTIHGRQISDELCQHLKYGRFFRFLTKTRCRFPITIHFLLQICLLHRIRWNHTYADVFQGLGKFPGEPYKLRLKPDAVPAKHRPRKVPVHLQDAFHEEVERLVKIDVLEKVTEPTEWVNSFVIVEKVIDSSNAHSPNHVIKKSIRLCIDPKDLNESIRKRTLLQQIH